MIFRLLFAYPSLIVRSSCIVPVLKARKTGRIEKAGRIGKAESASRTGKYVRRVRQVGRVGLLGGLGRLGDKYSVCELIDKIIFISLRQK